MEYHVHGDYLIEHSGDILIVRLFGSWNKEAAILFSQHLKQTVSQFNGRPWGNMLDMSKWNLATPDIWEVVEELAHWTDQNNHRFEAVVTNKIIEKQLMNQRFEYSPRLTKAFFPDEESALNWCRQQNEKLCEI
ncbi:hypothetical protein M9194_01655 [Vibrio sp. S4M6]|uniref:hypothetical protein n=1 Tax=Vibrio sinus TaxID=2946865 RepID=UPI00202A697D|nr:hypothetical protein [Vibrio sinus]MCL9780134.1 hypothetical protein [Vibrio sinus]